MRLDAGHLPNALIIGAAKCGTTSLHNYLASHPDICMSSVKETAFFVAERNWSKGLAWYRSHFRGQARVCGESSPAYTMHPRFSGVPERIHQVIPDVKLIYLVRDPIERIRSDYAHRVSLGTEREPLDKALFGPDARPWYIDNSRYDYQIRQYLQVFSRERILTSSHAEAENRSRMTAAIP